MEGGRYKPVPIDKLSAEVEQGHSAALNLHLRRESGELGLYVPETELRIATLEDESARADRERSGRIQAEARADREQAARLQVEARVRELEEQLQRRREE